VTEQLQFKISSELKSIIGRELITDDFIAIFELVKNSYDAGARKVEIIFKNIEKEREHAKIFVIDNGEGMSRADLEEKWLLVGYSWKREQEQEFEHKDFRDKISEKRLFAGAKGIGRFSCDRLGKNLKLYTKKENETVIHVLEMDWGRFEEDPEKQFQTINVEYETHDKLDIEVDIDDFKMGTILEISSLRERWWREKLLRLRRHLQRLINPAQVSEVQEFRICMRANEHLDEDEKHKEPHKRVNGIIRNVLFETLNIRTTNITCSLDKAGKSIYTELHDKGKFIFNIREKNLEYPGLHNVNIKLFYLNRSAKTMFTRTMGIQPVRYGSVFLYKNGIKINPYGNEGDDWLGLDRRKTQGTRRFLGNRDVVGRIEVSGNQPGFREVSSRDGGVIRTPELEQLKNLFFEKVLRRLERYVVEAINWDSERRPKDPEEVKADSVKIIDRLVGQVKDEGKKIAFNKDLLEIYEEKQVEKAPELIKNIAALKTYVKSKEEKDYLDQQIKAVRNAFRTLQVKKRELEEELRLAESQNIFLRSITDEEKEDILGLQHHIKLAVGKIDNYLLDLKDKIQDSKSPLKGYLINIIDNVLQQTHVISAIVLYVTKASFDVMTTTIEKDLVQFIKQYVENVYSESRKDDIQTRGASISVKLDEPFMCMRKFKPLDIMVILDNLIDNSIKALATRIEIHIKKLENGVEVRVRDNGKGIQAKNLNKIFDFGYSTTGGSGIGLYHVRKIAENNNWDIAVNDSLDKGAEFILKVVK